MEVYIKKSIKNMSFEQAEALVKEKLSEQGFGIVSEINMQTTFKNKLDVDFRPYKILGACNPKFAHSAIQSNDMVGVALPCNVCLQQKENKVVEVFAVNPLVAMEPLQTPEIATLGQTVYERLNAAIEAL
ncbi:DUF302 domain-containing protein [Roseimarinus sediminis]|uniref:DUF302 domain-containing protein n=1 Tax=Roseimarinus sediminis TaxID=1610899 RepID=UPI003D1D070E